MISIDSLPTEITSTNAVYISYREQLERLIERLELGLSVLVECDKAVVMEIYKYLRQRFKTSGTKLVLCSGHSALQAAMPTSLMQGMLNEIKAQVYEGSDLEHRIVVLPHLDVLTTTTKSSLSLEAREAIVSMFENPLVKFLAFKDPNFSLPETLENLFSEKINMTGIPRDALHGLITQKEARKLGVKEFNPYDLYKYVSGINPLTLRKIMSLLSKRMDYDPSNTLTAKNIYKDIRRMTVQADVDLPQVDLDKDIGGYDEVKNQIRKEILGLLQMKEGLTDPVAIQQIEKIIPKGMLFLGPPGTGKTLFAKAIATALNATIFIVSGPELKSKWVGESEAQLRNIFSKARQSAPSIIVFDELDSFATARGTYTGSGVEHSMVNQLLTEMDGFRKDELVFVVGTTNFAESIDPALLRPGRFELKIEIPYPDAVSREAICNVYIKEFQLQIGLDDLDHMVALTGDFVDATQRVRYSGDHIYAIFRELQREALRRKSQVVYREDIDAAILKKKKKASLVFSPEEAKVIAVHECGHALVAHILNCAHEIKKITIASDIDDVAGYVDMVLKEQRYVQNKSMLLVTIAVLLGGRVAEQITNGDITSGAWDDLQKATRIAKAMVEEFGMGESLGLRVIAGNNGLGNASSRDSISADLARKADDEISNFLIMGEELAQKAILDNKDAFNRLVKALLDRKTLSGAEMMKALAPPSYVSPYDQD